MKDFCTKWPDRWAHIDYSSCCKNHDNDYERIKHIPAGWKRLIERRKADYRLMWCVWDRGLPLMGLVMFIGVRLCGWLFTRRTK